MAGGDTQLCRKEVKVVLVTVVWHTGEKKKRLPAEFCPSQLTL